ncbi:MAG: hypothetical protein P1V97_34870 [Planctomycetota bacterium]|nr:hypothetical protein [Planctomycetota bacterium]
MRESIRRTIISLAALIVLWLTIYGPAFFHDFVNFDDPTYIYKEGMVTQGLSWVFSIEFMKVFPASTAV